MAQDTINTIYFAAGGLSTGIPMLVLWLVAWRFARDWKHLAEQSAHETERALHNFNSLMAQYLQLLSLYRRRENRDDDSEKWKWN